MCRSREAWTVEYAGAEGVAVVMRAKSAPAGRSTSETERDVKEPGLCSTRRSCVRSGLAQAGMAVCCLVCEPFEGGVSVLPAGGGAFVVVAVADDIVYFCTENGKLLDGYVVWWNAVEVNVFSIVM